MASNVLNHIIAQLSQFSSHELCSSILLARQFGVLVNIAVDVLIVTEVWAVLLDNGS